jgi:hypothetical protein
MRLASFFPAQRARLAAVALTLFAPALAAFAAPAADAPALAKLRFLFLDETPGAYVVRLGTQYRQISSATYDISASFTPPGPQDLEIYKTPHATDPRTGQPVRIKVATITPPTGAGGVGDTLVVIAPVPHADPVTPRPPHSVTFFPGDSARFPLRSVRVINLGRGSMAAQVGREQLLLQPGESRIVQPETDARYRVFAKIAEQTPGGWRLLHDSITLIRPYERVTGVLIFSPTGMRHTRTPDDLLEFGPPQPGHFWLTYSESF